MSAGTDKYSPMTPEQREKWLKTRLFPVELWRSGPDSTPLVCPMPDLAQMRTYAEEVPPHIRASGWYATRRRYEQQSIYADNFSGMGRQAIASVISAGRYSGPLAEFMAAACPRTVLRLLDRIDHLERELAAAKEGTAP
ncbi:hypothetical protein QTI51_03955 [Variovorax sp. J22G73]|uniref:hypothetical protein n=1 Tax=unclassified Variovorax TaxID=663243 RepID=UPI002576FC8C|nr:MULTISPECIES: hypothetical protein [unclassified Variovorax]MDM0003918.1 hypothetical protein [Variovorax sp. J22R203]MDM0096416.1 hypothetical protein [Variovorax sp. J22G73]